MFSDCSCAKGRCKAELGYFEGIWVLRDRGDPLEVGNKPNRLPFFGQAVLLAIEGQEVATPLLPPPQISGRRDLATWRKLAMDTSRRDIHSSRHRPTREVPPNETLR